MLPEIVNASHAPWNVKSLSPVMEDDHVATPLDFSATPPEKPVMEMGELTVDW